MKSDAEIIELVKAGQIEAFAELVTRYERLVRAAALHTVRERHAAEDVTQEAFVIALETIASLRDTSRFAPWLLGITRNRAAKAMRARCRSPALVGDVEAHPDDGRPLGDASALLLELVERLPEHERVVVGLKNLQGHSVPEIAAITGRPVGTVTKQLSRAYERLRNWYPQESDS
ncbi:MAG: RNA polymerase sigma factor [Deltaproteobacteria bacterium]